MNRYVTKTKELQAFEFLQGRMNFNQEESRRFYNTAKGYKGEKKFSRILKKHLTNNHLALYGLSHENGASWYQFDCLLIFLHKVLLIEIKNFKGEFTLKEDSLFSYISREEYNNPLHQLKRSGIYLQKLINLPVESAVVFVNPEFTLFHAEPNPQIVLPTQINSFIQKLNQEQGQVGVHEQNVVKKMSALHRLDSPYNRMPKYEYADLRKGMLCYHCRKEIVKYGRILRCCFCPFTEGIDEGILRHVIEFNLLFPRFQIMTGIIHEWIGGIVSRQTLREILECYLERVEKSSYTYYVFK